MRTTLDIDDPILREVRAIHEREGRSMGAIVSELLADERAIGVRGDRRPGGAEQGEPGIGWLVPHWRPTLSQP